MDFKRTRHSRPQYTGAGRAAGDVHAGDERGQNEEE